MASMAGELQVATGTGVVVDTGEDREGQIGKAERKPDPWTAMSGLVEMVTWATWATWVTWVT